MRWLANLDELRSAARIAHLLKSEAVAEFSSFRQLLVSTIAGWPTVTQVTFDREPDQSVCAVVSRELPMLCFDTASDAECTGQGKLCKLLTR
jgi:hypothetical protein